MCSKNGDMMILRGLFGIRSYTIEISDFEKRLLPGQPRLKLRPGIGSSIVDLSGFEGLEAQGLWKLRAAGRSENSGIPKNFGRSENPGNFGSCRCDAHEVLRGGVCHSVDNSGGHLAQCAVGRPIFPENTANLIHARCKPSIT